MFLKDVFDYEKSKEWKYKGDKPAIIDLYADWCGPCRQTAPIMKELAKEYAGKIVIYKVNVEKQKELTEPLDWHMIGHLQRNKVKQVVGRVKRIHSVDSIRLAKQIQLESEKRNITSDILIEVNMAKEESKYGFMPEEVEEAIREISTYPNVKIHGLMTIAPNVSNPEENRVHFRNLHKLLVDINGKNIDNINMNELSMGMTGDYEVAIEEGATYVRVGTGIFGNRQYL